MLEGALRGVGIVLAIWFVIFIIRMVFRGLHATARTVTGEGSLSENMQLAFKGMSTFQCRLVDRRVDEIPETPLLKALQVKGLFPIRSTVDFGILISLVDITDGDEKPVLCRIEDFQEPMTPAFQHVTSIGECSPGSGFPDWQEVGGVFPDIIQAAKSGKRKLEIILRLVDMDQPFPVILGICPAESPGLLATKRISFEWTFETRGYEEQAEHKKKSIEISISIAMAVAMADGSLDDTEGMVIKEWITKSLSPYSGEQREELKTIYNEALRQSYAEAKAGKLSLTPLAAKLKNVSEPLDRYEVIELCFEVMKADGVADPAEIQTIRRIADALDLNLDKIDKMRESAIMGLNLSVEKASLEEVLGIDPSWDNAKVAKFLRDEFQKWNSRINSLPEGKDREHAQSMIDMVSDAMKKYS